MKQELKMRRGSRPRITDEAKDKAVRLYLEDKMTVAEIAKECGFSVPSLYRILKERSDNGS